MWKVCLHECACVCVVPCDRLCSLSSWWVCCLNGSWDSLNSVQDEEVKDYELIIIIKCYSFVSCWDIISCRKCLRESQWCFHFLCWRAHRYKIYQSCSLTVWWDLLTVQVIACDLYDFHTHQSMQPSCSVYGGINTLEEITPIRIEMFLYWIKVIC